MSAPVRLRLSRARGFDLQAHSRGGAVEAVAAIADFFDNTGLTDAHPVWIGEDPSGRIALTLGHCRAIRAFLVAGPYPPPPHTIGDGAP